MAIKKLLKIGTKVKIKDTGSAYPHFNNNIVKEYIRRYKPCNASISSGRYYYDVTISSGYGTPNDLAHRQDLTWKIAYKRPINSDFIDENTPKSTERLYLIRSNQGHMLVIHNNALKYDR